MAEILAGRGAISRLGGRLRSSEALVYRVTADVDPGDLWPAAYQIRFDTRASNTPRAVAATLQEIDRLRRQRPHREELEVVRRELAARRRQEFDTAEEAVGHLVRDALVGRSDAYRGDYETLLAAVTAEDVRQAAIRHLHPDALIFVVAGPWGALAGPADDRGRTLLERTVGLEVEHLPARDPRTLATPEPARTP